MKKYYLYIFTIMSITLLLPIKTKAATSSTTVTRTTGTGETLTYSGTNYSQIFPDETYESTLNNLQVTVWKWIIQENLQIDGFTQGKYYNGYLYINYTIAGSNSLMEAQTPTITTTHVTEGVTAYLYGTGNSIFNLITFNNFYAETTKISLPTRTHEFYISQGSYNGAAVNINISFSGSATNTVSSEFPTTNGLCGQIWTALTNAIEGSDAIADIFATLDTIRQNDVTYYNGLLNQLTQSNIFLNAINTYTQQMNTKLQTIETNTTEILNDLEQYITFMQNYIPYLNNIATNTLNTYNQLTTIYDYFVKRPTIANNITNKHIYHPSETNTYYYSGTYSTNRTGITITKDQNIEYIYIYAFTEYPNYPEIMYFEVLEEGENINTQKIPNPTRSIKLTKNGYQYYTIDFKQNEKYCFINLGPTTYTYNQNFKAYIGNGYTYSALLYYIEMMENMNAEQSSKAAAAESAYNERNNQSETLIGGLNDVDRPTNNSGDFNILSNVDSTQKANFFGMLGTITNTSLITKILLIIVTAAIAGYILYGKK